MVIVGAFLISLGAYEVVTSRSESEHEAADYGTTSYETEHDTYDSGTRSPTSSPTTATESTSDGQPEVDAGPRPVTALGEHPINADTGTGAVSTACALPSFDTGTAAQSAFYEAALPCLMEMWTPALRAANVPVRMPDVVTTDSDVSSPCGTRGWDQTAMYCPSDNTIYMTARHYAETEGHTEPGVFLGQFAHEFGHAVQGMSGINEAYNAAVYDTPGPSSPEALELTRRSELQATCFGGMALAALQNGGVGNDYIFPALEDSANRGDEYNAQPDHGSTATNDSWVSQGFSRNRVFQCNTWLASASDVD